MFKKGELIEIPVWKILEIAGVDMDAKNVNLDTDGTSPYFRSSGVMIAISFEYYNFKSVRLALRAPELFFELGSRLGWVYSSIILCIILGF